MTLPALPKPVLMGSRLQVLPSLGQRLFADIPPTSFVTLLKDSRRKRKELGNRKNALKMRCGPRERANAWGLKTLI